MPNIDRQTCAAFPCRLAHALIIVGHVLGTNECFYLDGSFHFRRDGGWTISISPESAGQFQVAACSLSRPVVTLSAQDGEDDHLAGIVLELAVLTRQTVMDAA